MALYQGTQTLEVLEWAKNYNKWISSNFTPFVKSPLIEIGAGFGTISDHFLGVEELYLTDIDKDLVKILQKKYNNKRHIRVENFDITKAIKKDFQNKFATVVLVNVLEHIGKDQKALKNIYQLLKPEGKLLILVPAKRFAFTRLDESLGHKRRYERIELKEKLTIAGFQIEKLYFFNIIGLLSWWVRDKVEKSHQHLKPYQINFFEMIVPFLRIVESVKTPPLGISLIAIVKKP